MPCSPQRIFASFFSIALIVLILGLGTTSRADDKFQPVPPDDLKLTSEPLAQGAPAILLYRQVDRDDDEEREFRYQRIKILTEEGRKRADVELVFLRESEEIKHINARTIKPDGTIVNFSGEVYERPVAKSRRAELLAKNFSLPEVEVGSIIEYYYTIEYKHVYDSHWIVSDDLFTKDARFSLKPRSGDYSRMSLRWTFQGLPGNAGPTEEKDHTIRMEIHNVPAFQSEDYMPPVNELKSRVDFTYSLGAGEKDPDKFWRNLGQSWHEKLERFINKRAAMDGAARQIVEPGDSPEVKLRKIYARVQEIRNKSYEVRRTEQEEKRAKEKVDENVEDVWKRGYGSGIQLTWLYLGLVRAAGFESYGCWVASRKEYFFDPKTMQSSKLRANFVLVKLDGKDLFLDPGAEFSPFAMLTWSETGMQALCLNKDGGTWIRTPLPPASDSRIERSARLKLSETGDLEGKLTITYTGLEAMYHRLDVRHADDVARRKFAESTAVSQIPVAGATAKLRNNPEWNSSDMKLVAEYDLKVPAWASSAGKRMIMPTGFFTGHEKHTFEHTNRVHPIYFDYPYEKVDDVVIELPEGWQVGSVPPAQTKHPNMVGYDLNVTKENNVLHLTRKITIDFSLLDQKYYPALRNFYDFVRTADDQQIVLLTTASSALN